MAEDRVAMPESWAERELEFTNIEGQDKLSTQRNRVELGVDGLPAPVGLRVKITQHSNVLGARVYGVVHKVEWGKYKDKSACLLVVRFRFTSSSDVFRLRKAGIAMSFNNHPRRKIPQLLVGRRDDPVLRIFSPKQIYGIPTDVEHELVWSVVARCSVSAGPVSIGPEASRAATTRFTSPKALEIAGMDDADRDHDLPNIVIFEIDENSATSESIPKELYFGAVVQCDGGPIEADIETSIGDRSAWPWSRDDPIILKPGIDYPDVSSDEPRNFVDLTDADWKVLVPYQEERTNAVQWRNS